jgi:multicomponent Na+:H+ antiporter subunit F
VSAGAGPDPVQVASAVVLLAAAALTLWRLMLGPSVLDRSIALDTLTSLCLITVALVACVQRSGALLPVLLVVSLVGFTGSVTVARFAAGRDGREVSAEDDAGQGPAAGGAGDPGGDVGGGASSGVDGGGDVVGGAGAR